MALAEAFSFGHSWLLFVETGFSHGGAHAFELAGAALANEHQLIMGRGYAALLVGRSLGHNGERVHVGLARQDALTLAAFNYGPHRRHAGEMSHASPVPPRTRIVFEAVLQVAQGIVAPALVDASVEASATLSFSAALAIFSIVRKRLLALGALGQHVFHFS